MKKESPDEAVLQASMIDENEIVRVDDLVIHYEMVDGVAEALNGISLSVRKGETIGLVGETGAGKTTLALSIMGLLPEHSANRIRGKIYLEGRDMETISKKELREIRGKKISMIFQDPMTSLNPVMTVGAQIEEVVKIHDNLSKEEATAKAKEMLKLVGIPETRHSDYPHQFSGGMKQRVMIAMALACNPELLIADEPTTALDVTIQAQVLNLMRDLQKKYNTALILITHDFGIVADICQYCAVMYAGEIVEIGSIEQIFDNPQHPYTLGLFAALPRLDKDVHRLKHIKGLMSDPMNLPNYCSFYDRCDRHSEECTKCNPKLVEIENGHFVRCIHYEEPEVTEE